ncbi:MAG: hypothetical protein Q4G04_01735 [bacterium]|nr:hypothetical protein [bacterium]
MTPSGDNTHDVWAINDGKGVAKRRASRIEYIGAGGGDEVFYAYPTVYISSDLIVSGTGSISDPFVINRE